MDLFCQIFPQKARVYKIYQNIWKCLQSHDKIGLIREWKRNFNNERKSYEYRRYSNDLRCRPWSRVSMATVSRVVNGNKNVKSKIHRKKVLSDRTLDYRPNVVCVVLLERKPQQSVLWIPNITNSYFSTLAEGIDDIAEMWQVQHRPCK